MLSFRMLLEGYQERLTQAGVAQEVIEYIETLDSTDKGRAIASLLANPEQTIDDIKPEWMEYDSKYDGHIRRIDPTPKLRYYRVIEQWFENGSLAEYFDGDGEYINLQDVSEMVEHFDQNKNDYSTTYLSRFTDFEEFAKEYARAAGVETRMMRVKRGTRVLYDKEGLVVREITNYDASLFHAHGSRWCTRSMSDCETYLEDGPLYIVDLHGDLYQLNHDFTEFHDFMNQGVADDDVREKIYDAFFSILHSGISVEFTQFEIEEIKGIPAFVTYESLVDRNMSASELTSFINSYENAHDENYDWGRHDEDDTVATVESLCEYIAVKFDKGEFTEKETLGLIRTIGDITLVSEFLYTFVENTYIRYIMDLYPTPNRVPVEHLKLIAKFRDYHVIIGSDEELHSKDLLRYIENESALPLAYIAVQNTNPLKDHHVRLINADPEAKEIYDQFFGGSMDSDKLKSFISDQDMYDAGVRGTPIPGLEKLLKDGDFADDWTARTVYLYMNRFKIPYYRKAFAEVYRRIDLQPTAGIGTQGSHLMRLLLQYEVEVGKLQKYHMTELMRAVYEAGYDRDNESKIMHYYNILPSMFGRKKDYMLYGDDFSVSGLEFSDGLLDVSIDPAFRIGVLTGYLMHSRFIEPNHMRIARDIPHSIKNDIPRQTLMYQLFLLCEAIEFRKIDWESALRFMAPVFGAFMSRKEELQYLSPEFTRIALDVYADHKDIIDAYI